LNAYRVLGLLLLGTVVVLFALAYSGQYYGVYPAVPSSAGSGNVGSVTVTQSYQSSTVTSVLTAASSQVVTQIIGNPISNEELGQVMCGGPQVIGCNFFPITSPTGPVTDVASYCAAYKAWFGVSYCPAAGGGTLSLVGDIFRPNYPHGPLILLSVVNLPFVVSPQILAMLFLGLIFLYLAYQKG